jgi:ribonuclease HI
LSEERCWYLWVDGTALPNPGRIGLGLVLQSPAGETRSESVAPGLHGCSTQAELQAFCHGLKMAAEAGATRLLVVSDSDFVVRHVRGEAQTEVARLLPLVAEARALAASFAEVDLRWLPRHRNQEADHLARAALGLAQKPLLRPRRRRKGRSG